MAGADKNGPFKEFTLEGWFEDNFKESWSQFQTFNAGMNDFQYHLRNSQKEQLLAMRSLIDRAIEQIDIVNQKEQAEKSDKV